MILYFDFIVFMLLVCDIKLEKLKKLFSFFSCDLMKLIFNYDIFIEYVLL